ncbi:PilN domain-containing protein [Thiovibrio frasassiensis]|jgi:type IV pilus assembly protein PilN|uniref:PilN domain-containing protein n=1 Tax=Thiovibrio frasassiensis TaxID=2984131 RepID=A0A9X4RKT7_9BACT|nr:PilN domain-containing protein [Thiovibrio frasassiensis]MDG4475356.1 PilN domain-containing protein [Thiovibrio frasassiensis]
MIRINLLPIRQLKKRQRLKTELLGFCAALALVLFFLAGGWFALAGKINTLQDEIVTLEQKKQAFAPILKEIETLKKEKQLVEQKLDSIKTLQAGAKVTVRVLDEVASRTPTSRMWLSSLQQSTGRLQLQGIALDNETIAQYMQQLEASEYFEKTELTSSAQTDVAKQKLKSFSLTINVITPSS